MRVCVIVRREMFSVIGSAWQQGLLKSWKAAVFLIMVKDHLLFCPDSRNQYAYGRYSAE